MYNLGSRLGSTVVDMFYHIVHCLTDVVTGRVSNISEHRSLSKYVDVFKVDLPRQRINKV